jgi:hypothetical protein
MPGTERDIAFSQLAVKGLNNTKDGDLIWFRVVRYPLQNFLLLLTQGKECY